MKRCRSLIRRKILLIVILIFQPLFLSGGHATDDFIVGVNHPWIHYSQDFGENAWGHSGLSTNGWTYQTYPSSQGFVDTLVTSQAHSGQGSLGIVADLKGQDAKKSVGEVYIRFADNKPTLNLKGSIVESWIKLPSGSAGPANAPNGLQLIVKSENWYGFWSVWENIKPEYENKWVRFQTNLSGPAGFKDSKFDPTKVISVGFSIATNSASRAILKGNIYMDDFRIRGKIYNFEQTDIDRDFQKIKAVIGKCNKQVIRYFVFGDGATAPDFTANGMVKEIDKKFYRNFDALLAAAKKNGFLVIPVLLDGLMLNYPVMLDGVQLGGHSDLFRDPQKRKTFIDRALKPFLLRYGSNESILAVDIINEPEWGIRELQPTELDQVSRQEMIDFVRLCTDVIHANSSLKVTVGSAKRMWLSNWKGLGLDLYQFHWYPAMIGEEPFPWRPYSDLGLDKPCFIGEVSTTSTVTTDQYLKAAQDGGYSGLVVWSYRAIDDQTNFSRAIAGLKKWCSAQ